VIRAGYGVYYNFQPAFVGSRGDGWNPPYLLSMNQTFNTKLSGSGKTAFLPDITYSNPFPSTNAKSIVTPNPTISFLQWDFKNAVAQEWNLTIERQWRENWLTRTSYIGSQTHHIAWNSSPINQPLVQQPNVPTQQQRPFQPWGPINATRSGGKQNFNQLQAEIIKRPSRGMSFQVEYQFTRSLDNVPQSGGPQIWQYPALDYGNSQGLRRHWLIFNYVYDVPVGRGRTVLGNAGRTVDTAIGGWQVSGITSYGTGTPFTVTFNQTGTGKIGWWTSRTDSVAGADLYAGKQSGHDIVKGVQWFNTAAFMPSQLWQWGNTGRNTMWGPGSWNWDVSAKKNFKLTERFKLRFNADFLNAFNHFNLGAPNAAIADLRDGGTAAPTAGKITGGSGSRVVQLGLTLSY
jgi:hypothetical protein